MQTYLEQLNSGTEKTRRQALDALMQGGTEGCILLQDFLLSLPNSPHPPAPSPKKGEGEPDQSPSPNLGEGFRVRAVNSYLDSVAGRVYIFLSQHPDEGVQAFIQNHFPKGFLDLPSDRGIDYRPLEALLVQQQFQAADRLTLEKMCELAGTIAQNRKWVYFSEVDRFPTVDLKTIDTLWRIYSDDKFGFSVQHELWLGVGQNWEKLWAKIGWKQGNLWTRYPHSFTWNLNAPKGHLPLTNQLRGVRVMAALMNNPAFTHV